MLTILITVALIWLAIKLDNKYMTYCAKNDADYKAMMSPKVTTFRTDPVHIDNYSNDAISEHNRKWHEATFG